jgi:hypothetical protein
MGIDDVYPLSPEHRAAYARDGFVRLPGVLDAPTLARFRPESSAKVVELDTLHLSMAFISPPAAGTGR